MPDKLNTPWEKMHAARCMLYNKYYQKYGKKIMWSDIVDACGAKRKWFSRAQQGNLTSEKLEMFKKSGIDVDWILTGYGKKPEYSKMRIIEITSFRKDREAAAKKKTEEIALVPVQSFETDVLNHIENRLQNMIGEIQNSNPDPILLSDIEDALVQASAHVNIAIEGIERLKKQIIKTSQRNLI